jgi:hypothetical protein
MNGSREEGGGWVRIGEDRREWWRKEEEVGRKGDGWMEDGMIIFHLTAVMFSLWIDGWKNRWIYGWKERWRRKG